MTSLLHTVHVDLAARSYDIDIGRGIVSQIGAKLLTLGQATHAVVACDANTESYANQVVASLEESEVRTNLISVPAGEPSKSISQTQKIWDELLSVGTDRKSKIVAVGGGVVGDLIGFVAATFGRGLDFVQVPTTLLAQVDSSVGGKVGINLTGAKNMVGHFWQPKYVLIDTDVLSTLPEREYRCGLAEVVKYGVILDSEFFQYLEQHIPQINQRDHDVLAYIVNRCCRLKADVVENDERETSGLRAVLNYGHTFAHAFEAICGYGQILHGEAVSIGMLCASRLAESMNRILPVDTQRQFDLLSALGLPTSVPDIDLEAAIGVMQKDKKVEHGKLRFILPTRIGHVELVGDVDKKLVWNAFSEA